MNIPQDKEVFIGKIALNLLGKFSDYKALLQATFPDIYADLESASTNPNCTCRNKVDNVLTMNKETAVSVTNQFIADKDSDARVLDAINVDYASMVPKAYTGKMFEIPNTTESYAAFCKSIQDDRASYRVMSTAVAGEKADRLFIYFA